MRTIIIGDVHGCFEELTLLLEKLNFKEKSDRLIFLGDLINKGPYSLKTLNFVRRNNHECLLGNHELGFLRALENEKWRKAAFDDLLGQMGEEKDEIISWLKSLPFYKEESDFICVHGGLEPGVSLSKQKAEIVTRIRTWNGDPQNMDNEGDPAWYELYQGDRKVFFGHWAVRGYVHENNCIGLDTGCVWGGKLSAYIFEEEKLIQVPALRQYQIP